MIITMILIFVFGYLCIALEHKLRIDKAAIALLMCGALWTVLSLLGNDAQIGTQLIEQLGDTSEILFFLIGAMTIVELIDRHGGFHVITDHIKTRNKRKLLWLLSIITFFMSAVLDNMTTTIIMIMLLRRMISGQNMEESIKNRVSKVLKHIDMPTILFFLGILMSVAALQSAGLLTDFADFLDKNVHEVYTIAGITGLLSAVIDNVPLVAACMGMYPVVDTAALASSLDPVYMQAFVQDGIFWHLLTFCAGVGGSLLIIGSAAGVVAMGLEKIEFGWYLRKITLLALAGYFAGMLVIFLEHLLLG